MGEVGQRSTLPERPPFNTQPISQPLTSIPERSVRWCVCRASVQPFFWLSNTRTRGPAHKRTGSHLGEGGGGWEGGRERVVVKGGGGLRVHVERERGQVCEATRGTGVPHSQENTPPPRTLP
jgi:hypothetical protein